MIASAACAVVAALLLAQVVRLHRRLELVAQAEHELRGPLGALALGLEAALGRSAPAPELLPGLELQLERARVGLADLGAAREGRRAAPRPQRVAVEPFLHAASLRAPLTTSPNSRQVNAPAAGICQAARAVDASVAAAVAPASGKVEALRPSAVVRVDPGRLAQALGNVVDNAVEHGGGHFEVRVAATAHTIRLDVSDQGRGRLVPRPSRARRRAGRGRGLVIATRAVEEAGGRLSMRSGPGGAVVSMELPRAEA